MADKQKQLTLVLTSKGTDKLEAQFKAMQQAASLMGSSVDSALSSINLKTNTVRQTFKIAVDNAISLKQAMEQVNTVLGKTKGLNWLQDNKIKTALISGKERELPAPKMQLGSNYSEEWKLANAERAAANKLRLAEEVRAQKEQARDYVSFWKEALREKAQAERAALNEKIRAEKAAEQERLALINSSIGQKTSSLAGANKLNRTQTLYGEDSFQTASVRAALQEQQVRATLSAQVNKIRAQYSDGKFGIKAANNRLDAVFAQAEKELAKVNTALGKYKKNLQEADSAQSSFATRVLESISIYRLFNFTLNKVGEGLASIPRIGIQLDQTNATLTAVFGNTGQAAKQIQFLNEEAQRTGLTLSALRQSYATFSASALLAGQSAASVQKIFADVNTTATTLHLSTDQVNGVFLALSQMFNKGKVQAEELTKQLSQTLPGITNQTAKALGLSAAELGDAMKKGLISADEAVQKMMAKMAEAFGGEAFIKASSNLNAELGRLSTAWTHLGENVYKSSEGMLISVVRSTAGMINSLAGVAGNAYETQRAFTAWGTTLGAVVLGALSGLILKSKAATFAISALKGETLALQVVSKTFGVGGMIAGLSLLTSAAIDAKTSLENAKTAAQKIRDRNTAEHSGNSTKSAELAFEDQADTQIARGHITRLQERFKVAKGWGATKEEQQALIDIKTIQDQLLKEREKFIAEWNKDPSGEKKPFEVENFEKIQNEIKARLAKESGNKKLAAQFAARASYQEEITKTKAELDRANKALGSGTLDEENKQKATQYVQFLKGQLADIETAIQDSGKLVKDKGVATALRAEYKDISAIFQEQRNAITESLAELDTAYAANTVSISAYFSEKRRLTKEDIELQQKSLIAQRDQAKAGGDVVKEKTVNLQLLQLSGKAKKEEEKETRAQVAAYKDLKDIIAEVNAEYLNMQGKGSGGALIEFDRKNKERIAKLKQEQANPQTLESGKSASEALQQIEAQRSYTIAVEAATKANVDYSISKDNLSLKEARIQNDLKLGVISELEALFKTQQARREAVAEMDVYIKKQEEALRGQPENSDSVRAIKHLREEWKNLAAETDLFKQKFSNIFENNFAEAFTSFATNAAAAGQAFESFTKGVIKNLLDIAAREASTGLTNLAGAAGKALFPSLFASARGNVFQNNNVVPFALGGLPDVGSQKQFFPMADGRIGSIREQGPEAIVPLFRGSDGKLGIRQANSNSSGGDTYYTTITVEAAKGDNPDILGSKIATSFMRNIARQEIATAMRPTNMLNKA